MTQPLVANNDCVNVKPELMEKEKLYYCIFNEKIILAYKDQQEFLNCYEIEEKEIIDKVISSQEHDIDNILNEFIKNQKLKIN